MIVKFKRREEHVCMMRRNSKIDLRIVFDSIMKRNMVVITNVKSKIALNSHK